MAAKHAGEANTAAARSAALSAAQSYNLVRCYLCCGRLCPVKNDM